jgi:hypothetical protein
VSPRARRIASAVAAALALLWGLYVVVGNAMLWTGFLEDRLDRNPEKMLVRWKHAYTVLPGRVTVDGFSMRFQDDHVQMLLGIERATFQIDVLALAKRTFHVTHLDGRGTTFRLRHKLNSPDEAKTRAESFPPIPGYEDPPVVPIGAPKPPIPDSQYHLWTVQLDDVSSSIREVWVMEYRYTGAGSVAGGFRLRPLRELELQPSVLLTKDGVLAIGEQQLLLHSKGQIEAQIPRFDVRGPHGLEVFHQIDATVDLDGDLVSLAPLGHAYVTSGGFALDRGAGHLALHVRAARGVLTPDTHVAWSSDDVLVRTPKGVVEGKLAAEAFVANGALAAAASIAEATLLPEGSSKAALAAHDAKAHVDLGNADLAGRFRVVETDGAVATLAAPDLRTLKTLLPPAIAFHGGAASGTAHARWADDELGGRADVAFEHADVSAGPVRVTTNGKAFVELAPEGAQKSRATLGLDLSGANVRLKDESAAGLWLDARSTNALVAFTSASEIDLPIVLRAGPGDRVLHLAASLGGVPPFLADAAAGPDLRASVRVTKRAAETTVDVRSAKDGSVEAKGAIAREKERTEGAFLVSVGNLRAGIELDRSGASVVPAAGPDWLEEKRRSVVRQR